MCTRARRRDILRFFNGGRRGDRCGRLTKGRYFIGVFFFFLNLSFIDSVASKSSYSLITIMKNCIAQKSRITITMCGMTTLQMKSRTYPTDHPTLHTKRKTYNIYPPTLPLTPSNPLLILPPGDVAGCGRRKSTLMAWASLNLTSG